MTITGFHSIEEKIRSLLKNKDAAPNYKLFYSKPGPRVKKILAVAKEAGVTAEQTDDNKLDDLVKDLDETLQDKALPWYPERTFRVAEKEIVATHV